MPRPLLLPVLTLAACGGDGASFALTLHPYAPMGQDPFGASVTAVLTVDEAAGLTTTSLGALGGDARSAAEDHLGPLDEAYVGLALQSGGDDYDPAQLVAFGEVGPFTLLDEEQEADVLVPAVAGIGGLDTLDADHGALQAGIAMMPDGSTWLFGGGRDADGPSGTGHASVQALASLDAGTWTVDPATELPDFDTDGTADPRYGLTATVVTTPDGPRIFVAGGRPRSAPVEDNTRDAALFDPATRTWEWTTRSMIGTRSQHHAVRLVDGQVLLVGGYAGAGVVSAATWELFDPTTRTFRAAPQPLPNGPLAFDVAPLAGGGALLCGGTNPADDAPQADCSLLSASGSATPTAALPTPLTGLALVTLADGRVLATGGAGDAVSDRAFLWDPSSESWSEIDPLGTARTQHRAIPLPDGGAVIVGGVGANGAPVRCAERFDATAESFTPAEPCGAAGSGAWPLAAWDDRHGAVVVSGVTATDGTGGSDVGVVGFPPVF